MNKVFRSMMLLGCSAFVCLFACNKEGESIKPGLTSFLPKTATAGDPVKITGIALTGASKVSFGGVDAASFRVVSDSVIFAYPATGSVSGSVSVVTGSGTTTMTGFTYYTPVTFKLTGTCRWSTLSSWPSIDSSGYRFVDLADSGSVSIRNINPYDTARLLTELMSTPVITPYVDSAGYVLLEGVVVETRQVTSDINVSGYRFTMGNTAEKCNVFAKITDTLVTIPKQSPRWALQLWGSGSLKNNKLVLNYITDVRNNRKTATVSSP
jgi:hypothetical protein